ncbi:hypothetical protein E2C01_054571 [Portunus trituberculatus]|uniref:Uncharacterized protein n=1 Tax=Portunus trituberculatus TaxID=210409 RepID=A0A5B7GVD9_PORTR|nr:hypothetical protein [Portunus trituberculatus]
MISILLIAETLLRTKLLISVDFENSGNITYVFLKLFFLSHGFLRVF